MLAMPKKPIGAETVEQYLGQIEEPRRSEIRTLDALIRKSAPKLTPSIQAGMIGYGTYHYQYASGREGDAAVIALASQKNYISVYICATGNGEYLAEKHKADFPNASIGRSCIRFKKLEDLDTAALARLVKLRAKLKPDS